MLDEHFGGDDLFGAYDTDDVSTVGVIGEFHAVVTGYATEAAQLTAGTVHEMDFHRTAEAGGQGHVQEVTGNGVREDGYLVGGEVSGTEGQLVGYVGYAGGTYGTGTTIVLGGTDVARTVEDEVTALVGVGVGRVARVDGRAVAIQYEDGSRGLSVGAEGTEQGIDGRGGRTYLVATTTEDRGVTGSDQVEVPGSHRRSVNVGVASVVTIIFRDERTGDRSCAIPGNTGTAFVAGDRSIDDRTRSVVVDTAAVVGGDGRRVNVQRTAGDAGDTATGQAGIVVVYGRTGYVQRTAVIEQGTTRGGSITEEFDAGDVHRTGTVPESTTFVGGRVATGYAFEDVHVTGPGDVDGTTVTGGATGHVPDEVGSRDVLGDGGTGVHLDGTTGAGSAVATESTSLDVDLSAVINEDTATATGSTEGYVVDEVGVVGLDETTRQGEETTTSGRGSGTVGAVTADGGGRDRHITRTVPKATAFLGDIAGDGAAGNTHTTGTGDVHTATVTGANTSVVTADQRVGHADEGAVTGLIFDATTGTVSRITGNGGAVYGERTVSNVQNTPTGTGRTGCGIVTNDGSGTYVEGSSVVEEATTAVGHIVTGGNVAAELRTGNGHRTGTIPEAAAFATGTVTENESSVDGHVTVAGNVDGSTVAGGGTGGVAQEVGGGNRDVGLVAGNVFNTTAGAGGEVAVEGRAVNGQGRSYAVEDATTGTGGSISPVEFDACTAFDDELSTVEVEDTTTAVVGCVTAGDITEDRASGYGHRAGTVPEPTPFGGGDVTTYRSISDHAVTGAGDVQTATVAGCGAGSVFRQTGVRDGQHGSITGLIFDTTTRTGGVVIDDGYAIDGQRTAVGVQDTTAGAGALDGFVLEEESTSVDGHGTAVVEQAATTVGHVGTQGFVAVDVYSADGHVTSAVPERAAFATGNVTGGRTARDADVNGTTYVDGTTITGAGESFVRGEVRSYECNVSRSGGTFDGSTGAIGRVARKRSVGDAQSALGVMDDGSSGTGCTGGGIVGERTSVNDQVSEATRSDGPSAHIGGSSHSYVIGEVDVIQIQVSGSEDGTAGHGGPTGHGQVIKGNESTGVGDLEDAGRSATVQGDIVGRQERADRQRHPVADLQGRKQGDGTGDGGVEGDGRSDGGATVDVNDGLAEGSGAAVVQVGNELRRNRGYGHGEEGDYRE